MNGLGRIAAVGAASLVLWTREVARLVGTTTRAVRIGATFGGFVAALFGLALAVIAGRPLTAEAPEELRSSVVRTSFAAAALTAGLVAVVLCVSAPVRGRATPPSSSLSGTSSDSSSASETVRPCGNTPAATS